MPTSTQYLALGLLHAGQVAPLLDRLRQVDLVQGNLHLANLVVLRESVWQDFVFFKKPCHWRRQSVRQTRAKIILPVKVVDSKHQRLGGDLGVGHLKVERLIEHGIQCLAVNFGLELFLLVGQ